MVSLQLCPVLCLCHQHQQACGPGITLSDTGDAIVDKPAAIPKGSSRSSGDGQMDTRYVGRMLRCQMGLIKPGREIEKAKG